MLVVAIPFSCRSTTAVCSTVHSAPSSPGDRRRLAWRPRPGLRPALIRLGHVGLGHLSHLSGTHGVVRQFWSPPRFWPQPSEVSTAADRTQHSADFITIFDTLRPQNSLI